MPKNIYPQHTHTKSLRQKVRHLLQSLCPDFLGLFPFYPPEEDYTSPHVQGTRYDHDQDLFCFVAYSAQENAFEFFLDNTALEPMVYKISCPHHIPSPLMRHQIWVHIPRGKGFLRVEMQESPCTLYLHNTVYEKLSIQSLYNAFPLPTVPFYAQKYAKAWLFMDRAHVADDNAEHLYRHIQKHHPEQPIYFALQKNCPDWQRLKKENFNLIDVNSFAFKILLHACQLIASSHMDIFLWENIWAHSTKARKKHVHLRHGVSYIDQSQWYNSPELYFNLLTATTFDEYKATVNNKSPYNYTSKDVKLLGITRHDALVPHIQKHKGTLLIMPTWRKYLQEYNHAEALAQSPYVQHWDAVLTCEKLRHMAEQHNLKIVFYLHNNMRDMREAFSNPKHITFVSQKDTTIQELFTEATLMITDYSSVSFEMAFLEKPLMYYQFDAQHFFNHHWKEGYFSFQEHGFGPIATTHEELMKDVHESLEKGHALEPYLSRMQKTFAHKDGNNCARTYAAMKQLFQPLTTPSHKG